MASSGAHVSSVLDQLIMPLQKQSTAIQERGTDDKAMCVMARGLFDHHRADTTLMATLQNTMAIELHAKPST